MTRLLRDPDGMDWNEPFVDIIAVQDQRVRDEGYVVLGQSVISSSILDSIQLVLLVSMLALSEANVHLDKQLGFNIFEEVAVWRKMALSLAILIAGSVALGKVVHWRVGPVRMAFTAHSLHCIYLVLKWPHPDIRPRLVPAVLCLLAAIFGVLAAPVLTHYLQKHYQRASFAHKHSLSLHQTALLSDVLGRNVRRVEATDLGLVTRNGYRRLLAARHDDAEAVDGAGLADFRTVIRDQRRSRLAFLLFAADAGHRVSRRRFAETVGSVLHEWLATQRSLSRASSVFSVLTGLLDFAALGMVGMFAMAVFGYSILHLIATALFVYGLINSFFGVAITQWKMGAYLILGRHPYDIGDLVRVPGCGAGALKVLDYSLTTSLFKKLEGQSLTVVHRDIAFKVITNLSRPQRGRVVVSLSADEGRDLPIIQVVQDILRHRVVDYFLQDFRLDYEREKYGLDSKPKIQLTYADGLNSNQRMRGLVIFCSSMREASLESRVEDEELQ